MTAPAGQTIVVKYGGAALAAAEAGSGADPVLAAAVALQHAGARLVLVHGGGPEVTAMMRRLGKEPVFIDGLRVTDAETAEIAEMVLAGRVNKGLVDRLQRLGGRAAGLSGKDGGIFRARKRPHRGAGGREVDLGFVGEIVAVDTALVEALLAAGWMPVVASVAPGEDGRTYNVNADLAAAALAGALRADRFVLLTDVPGVLRDRGDPSSLIAELGAREARELIAAGVAGGGMIPKLEACLAALDAGAAEAWIADGRDGAALGDLVRGRPAGTRITAAPGGGRDPAGRGVGSRV